MAPSNSNSKAGSKAALGSKPRVLVLCHGKTHVAHRDPEYACFTPLVPKPVVARATLLDVDATCKPTVVHDWRKPFRTRAKYDVVTTACCDSDVFYDASRGAIVDQSFANVDAALGPRGVFILPKYHWLDRHVLDSIKARHLTYLRSVKTDHEHYYLFGRKQLKGGMGLEGRR